MTRVGILGASGYIGAMNYLQYAVPDLDKMLAEPFEPFTFSPAGAAIYQLGPFGTAAKKLKEWDLKP